MGETRAEREDPRLRGWHCRRRLLIVGAAALAAATAAVGLPTHSAVKAACPPSSWQPNPPPGFQTNPRSITDGQTTAGSSVLTSPAQAQFTQYDKGRGITGTNVPANTTIVSVRSATSVVLSNVATATGSGLSATIAGGTWQNPSTAIVATPDGSTVVYTNNGWSSTSPTSPGWVGVESSPGFGLNGYIEYNTVGNSDPNYQYGFLVVAGSSPVGSGGVTPQTGPC